LSIAAVRRIGGEFQQRNRSATNAARLTRRCGTPGSNSVCVATSSNRRDPSRKFRQRGKFRCDRIAGPCPSLVWHQRQRELFDRQPVNNGPLLLRAHRSHCFAEGNECHCHRVNLYIYFKVIFQMILLSFVYMPRLYINLVPPLLLPCAGSENRPAPFPGRMSYKATKRGLVSVLYLSIFRP